MTPETKKKARRFAVRVATPNGDMYLRRGARPGRGPVVRFNSKRDADMAIATMEPGFEHGWHADVVPYSSSLEEA